MQQTHFYEDGTLVISLSGEIDHHEAKKVRSEIDRLIDEYRPNQLILDLGGIVFCDSSGLGLIMGRYKKMCSVKGKIYIYKPSESVKKILYLSGMDKLVKIHER